MQKTTGTQAITTVNFTGGFYAESEAWTAKQVATWGEALVDGFAEAHRQNEDDADYTETYGAAQTFEYEVPGARIVALLTGGRLMTVWIIENKDAVRIARAARREQPVTVTYTKADGTETVRTIEPTGLKLTQAGDTLVIAMDRLSGEKRSFRLDRVSAYTVHRTRRTVRTEAPAPAKADLWASFQAHAARSEDAMIAEAELDGRYVQDFRNGQTGVVEPGSRALSASGWSVIVRLTGTHRNATASGTVRVSESHLVKITRKDVQEARALRTLNRARLARR